MPRRQFARRLRRVVVLGGGVAFVVFGFVFFGRTDSANSNVFVVISSTLSAVSFSANLFAERHGRTAARKAGPGFLGAAARLLPGSAAAWYQEEWRGELYDRRADGERWWRRAAYVCSILLYCAPTLAITLRLSRTRAVD